MKRISKTFRRSVHTPFNGSMLMSTHLRCGVGFALALTLGGCALTPYIKDESKVGVTPRKLEKVVVVLNSGVFYDERSFGKFHVEHLGDAIAEELDGGGIKSTVVLIRPMDINQAVVLNTVKSFEPSHIIRITATERVSYTQGKDRVTWLVQLDQKDQDKNWLAYTPGFKLTIGSSTCRAGTIFGIEPLLTCFRELSAPILSTLHKKGF